jgi:hypothetical protein
MLLHKNDRSDGVRKAYFSDTGGFGSGGGRFRLAGASVSGVPFSDTTMGTTLDAIVERFYEAQQLTPTYRSPDSWEAVCQWEFNKDYSLMLALGRHAQCHEGWPVDAGHEARRLQEQDIYHRAYWFAALDLPTSFESDGETFEPNERYRAMVAGLTEFKGPVRVIFLEC